MENNIYDLTSWTNLINFLEKKIDNEIQSSDVIAKLINNKIPYEKWKFCEDWEQYSDEEILGMLLGLKEGKGKCYIVTDLSYKEEIGPFQVEFEDLSKFIKSYSRNYEECFFNGDVYLFSLDLQKLWIFHHEGVFGCFDYRELKKTLI